MNSSSKSKFQSEHLASTHEAFNQSKNLIKIPMVAVLKRASVLMLFLLLGVFAKAQSPIVYVDWTSFEESSQFLDVAYKVVKCDVNSDTQILIELMNENHNVSKTSFELNVTDIATGQITTFKVYDYAIPYMQIHKPYCTDGNYPELRLKVPSSYDSSNLKFEITYL